MLKNYFKIAIRNLVKHKVYSVINILSLAVGLAITILIFLWARDEMSYDQFNKDADNIYRVYWDFNWRGNAGLAPGTPPPLAEAITSEIPEVTEATRIYPISSMVVHAGEKVFNENKIFAVDPNLFDFFTYEIIAGNESTALENPNSVVLTESTAKKYFGNKSAYGKFIRIGQKHKEFRKEYDNIFKVTGVIKDPPHNSHFQFDMLTSISSYPAVSFFDWSWVWMQVTTYTKLKPGVSPKVVESKIQLLVQKYAPKAFERVGFSYKELIANGGHWNFDLQPMKDVYLGSAGIGNNLGPLGSRINVYMFSIIAVFVLFLACINFINLTTAQSGKRVKEISIRKTLGSQKSLIVGQFLTESMMYCFFALILALLIVEIFIVPFNNLTSKNISINWFTPWWMPVLLIGTTLFVGFLSGSYPGFYLSSFLPVQILKGKSAVGNKSKRLRDVLVIFQFAITIALIVGVLLVKQQMNFLLNYDLGFNKGGVVFISNQNNLLHNQAEVYKEKIENLPGVISASVSTGVPPFSRFTDYYKIEGRGDEQFSLSSYLTDEDFCSTMGIHIIKGRGFSKDFTNESHNVVLNESAVKYFGWKNPIGKRITYPGRGEYTVIGVMKDFNLLSLYFPIEPFALFHNSSKMYDTGDSYIVVHLSKGNFAEKLQHLKNDWQNFAPDAPFKYEFLDRSFEAQYVSEKRLGKIIMIFSLLAIFIACIGLLGLAAFSAEQRTKEIGVRKVLGASTPNILILLNKEFTKWVLLANIIAWPVAWYFMNKWLQNFAYRINISWWVFVLAGGITLAVALATVSFQAIKAATANPVESLRYE